MKKGELIETFCIKKSAKELGFFVREYSENGNLFSVQVGGKELFFKNGAGPWNKDSIYKIFKDKEYLFLILKDVVNMPYSKAFFDPFFVKIGEKKKEISNREKERCLNALAERIEKNFSFPFILKMNSGSKCANSFLVRSRRGVVSSLGKIFDKKSRLYDYMALASRLIEIKEEYRVILFRGKIVLLYKKGEYLPIKDKKTLNDFADFLKPAYQKIKFDFGALDVAINDKSIKYLLEINSEPGFSNFVAKNGEGVLVEMYKRILITYNDPAKAGLSIQI